MTTHPTHTATCTAADLTPGRRVRVNLALAPWHEPRHDWRTVLYVSETGNGDWAVAVEGMDLHFAPATFEYTVDETCDLCRLDRQERLRLADDREYRTCLYCQPSDRWQKGRPIPGREDRWDKQWNRNSDRVRLNCETLDY